MRDLIGFGATQDEDPLSELSLARPDLLTVDPPRTAVEDCGGAHTGEIGAGAGLTETLAPVLVAPQNRREKTLLLLRTSEGDESGTKESLSEEASSLRSIGECVLLGEGQLFGYRCRPPTELLRPRESEPTGTTEFLLPSHSNRPIVSAHLRGRTEGPVLPHEIVGQPAPYLVAETRDRGIVGELHDDSLASGGSTRVIRPTTSVT